MILYLSECVTFFGYFFICCSLVFVFFVTFYTVAIHNADTKKLCEKNVKILFLLLLVIFVVYATNSFPIEFVDCFTENTNIEQASEISSQVSETSEPLNNDKGEKVAEKRKATGRDWINFVCYNTFVSVAFFYLLRKLAVGW
jgi:hypothetical protein